MRECGFVYVVSWVTDCEHVLGRMRVCMCLRLVTDRIDTVILCVLVDTLDHGGFLCFLMWVFTCCECEVNAGLYVLFSR